jgi:hypothetical protein
MKKKTVKAEKKIETPICVKPQKVLIAEVGTDLGRDELNALAHKINEVIKAINAL